MTDNELRLGTDTVDRKIILITGTSRAGKTLLSKTLGSYANVEWIEEPYAISNLIILRGLGRIDEDLFRKMFTYYVHEMTVENILLRNANFRPDDLSSIWNYKSASDIFYRMHTLKSRTDVDEYIKKVNPYFILDIPDILPFTDLIKPICDDITVINVVRNGFDVADDCYRKGWYAEDDTQLADNNIFMEYNGHKLPWWVRKGEEEGYLNSELYEKGLIYWLNIQSCRNESEPNASPYDLYIRYEDMVDDLERVLADIEEKLNISRTTITEDVSRQIVSRYTEPLKYRDEKYSHYDSELFNETMRKFGY